MALTNNILDAELKKFRDAGGVKTKIAVTSDQDSESLRFDKVSTTLMYLGTSAYGSLESEAKWKIQKIDTSSGVSIKNASEFSDQIWDNRASLTYV